MNILRTKTIEICLDVTLKKKYIRNKLSLQTKLKTS